MLCLLDQVSLNKIIIEFSQITIAMFEKDTFSVKRFAIYLNIRGYFFSCDKHLYALTDILLKNNFYGDNRMPNVRLQIFFTQNNIIITYWLFADQNQTLMSYHLACHS